MTHRYDSSHDKLMSSINQRLLSSQEFTEDYSTINQHRSPSKGQLDTSPSRFSKRPSLISAIEADKTGSKTDVHTTGSRSSNRSSKASTNYVNNQRQSMNSIATNSRPVSQSLHQEYSEYATWKNQFQNLISITPLMPQNQHIQSQHFRMSQRKSVKSETWNL